MGDDPTLTSNLSHALVRPAIVQNQAKVTSKEHLACYEVERAIAYQITAEEHLSFLERATSAQVLAVSLNLLNEARAHDPNKRAQGSGAREAQHVVSNISTWSGNEKKTYAELKVEAMNPKVIPRMVEESRVAVCLRFWLYKKHRKAEIRGELFTTKEVDRFELYLNAASEAVRAWDPAVVAVLAALRSEHDVIEYAIK